MKKYENKKSYTIMKNLIYLLLLIFPIVFNGCNQKAESSIKNLHTKYMDASINHDIETLGKMTHDSIVWILGPYIFKGKEAALGPNRYDKGTDAKIEYKNVTIRHDTVEFELFEQNEILTAMDMEGVRGFPRFIFKNGLLYKKEVWKPSPDIKLMMQRSEPRRNWIKENHPDIFQRFFDSKGDFIWSEENGKLQIQMAREWKKAIKDDYKSLIIKGNDELLIKGNLSYADELFSKDYAGRSPEVIKEFVRQLRIGFPDLQITIDPIIAEGNKVAWRRTIVGTHQGKFRGFPPTGKKIKWQDFIISRFEDSKIVEQWFISELPLILQKEMEIE